jgi:hypothetical protein
MIKGIVKIDNDLVKGVTIYESNATGTPLLKNNRYLTTLTNDKGEYLINLPKDKNFYLTFKFVGTKQQTLNTLNLPKIVNLIIDNTLEEFEMKGKRTYYWLLLLLIPIIYKLSKKK